MNEANYSSAVMASGGLTHFVIDEEFGIRSNGGEAAELLEQLRSEIPEEVRAEARAAARDASFNQLYVG